MKHILALLSWGQICIPKEPEAFTFAKMEVGHPVRHFNHTAIVTSFKIQEVYQILFFGQNHLM